ncbi:UNVERIFIED_CONTAM: hypothetical protein Sangu_2532300 [Sesamum angustifolium]|uniref:Reverse transcriptase domain-containing protein n=1 Tax=Sesamum angustifolium TaxID=2727405 RepID=A0AAW2JC87_9LAMI
MRSKRRFLILMKIDHRDRMGTQWDSIRRHDRVLMRKLSGQSRNSLLMVASPGLIGELYANAFILDRSISDNILLSQELFSRYNQQRLPQRCAMKVDLRKVYDTMEWDFLLATLHLFGFPRQFILWIQEYVITCNFSVNLNGNIHGFFQDLMATQGDPVSPYLCVLVMEVFQLIIQKLIDPQCGVHLL